MRPIATTLMLAAASVLTGCLNSDTADGPVEMTLVDIVTFEGNTLDGNGSTFSFIPADDEPEVVLTADRAIDTETVAPGHRLLISYKPESGKPYTSGPISLVGAALINDVKAHTVEAAELVGWDATPIYVVSLWRSGRYINLRARVAATDKPRRFDIVCDNPEAARPDLYIAHQLPEGVSPDTTWDHTIYASFDISDFWTEAVEGVTIHVNNSNLTDKTTFKFDK